YLMHYNWRISHSDIDPKDGSRRSGLNIEWDHGELEKSREAAKQMVNLCGRAHIASLTSNHIRGKASDMTSTWKGTLVMTRPAPPLARIDSLPRSGQNRELHDIGATVFGVRKLLSDPPHWSYNGR